MVVCTVIAAAFQPWVLKYVVDGLKQALNREKLLIYAGIILGLSIVEGFFRFWMRRILIGVSRDIEYDLRNDFLAHVQKMSLSFLQSRSTGDIMSRATNDLNAVRSVLGPGIMYSMNTIVLGIISTYILLRLNWQLTLLAYIPLVIMSFTVKRIGGQIHDRFESIQEQFSNLSTKAQENISGIRVVKAFAREESEIAEFGKLNVDYVRRNVSLIRLWGLFYPLDDRTYRIVFRSPALVWRATGHTGAPDAGGICRFHGIPGDADLAHHRRRLGDEYLPARRRLDGTNTGNHGRATGNSG